MSRETLRGYLHNYPLVQAIEQKRSIDETKRNLLDAMQIMRETGVDEGATAAVQSKYEEYQKISRAYGNMIEDVWGIPWQKEEIIKKYTDCLDDDIDRLPDTVRIA